MEVWFWSPKWHFAPPMSGSSATHAPCLCSDMKGCLMGALFCFGGEKGRPHDPAMFIYFILRSARWVKREKWGSGSCGSVMRDFTTAHTGSPVCSSETGNTPDSIRARSIRVRIGFDSRYSPSSSQFALLFLVFLCQILSLPSCHSPVFKKVLLIPLTLSIHWSTLKT